MSLFDKLSVKQILVLSEILAESSLVQTDFIRARYLNYALNFNETVEFIEKLKLIEVRDNQILPKPRYKAFLREINVSNKKTQILQNYLVELLFFETTTFSRYIRKFIANFHFKRDHFIFIPTASQRLAYSGLRNFLIDLGFVYLDSSGVKYVISDSFSLSHSKLAVPHKLTPEEFAVMQQKNQEIGRNAELRVIEYEKQRLSHLPRLAERIEHVASSDMSAGYDVRSFEATHQKDPILRLIEVKAVSPFNFRFEWTRNEIETSKRHRKAYYLYLVPVVGKGDFDMEEMKMIRDPYSTVYKNTKEWVRFYELVSFCNRSPRSEGISST